MINYCCYCWYLMRTTAVESHCTRSSPRVGPHGPSEQFVGWLCTDEWPAWAPQPAGTWGCVPACAVDGDRACEGTQRSGVGEVPGPYTVAEALRGGPGVSSVSMRWEGMDTSVWAVFE